MRASSLFLPREAGLKRSAAARNEGMGRFHGNGGRDVRCALIFMKLLFLSLLTIVQGN
jgi:hypothetical protein